MEPNYNFEKDSLMLQNFDEVVQSETDKFNLWLLYNQMYHLERYLGMRHQRSKEPSKIEKSLQARNLFVPNKELVANALPTIKNQMSKIPTSSLHYEKIRSDYSAISEEAERQIDKG